MPFPFVSRPAWILTPPSVQFAPGDSAVTLVRSATPLVPAIPSMPFVPLVPFIPGAPLQTYSVDVTSDGSRTPLPFVSMPDSILTPPAAQLVPGGSTLALVRPEDA